MMFFPHMALYLGFKERKVLRTPSRCLLSASCWGREAGWSYSAKQLCVILIGSAGPEVWISSVLEPAYIHLKSWKDRWLLVNVVVFKVKYRLPCILFASSKEWNQIVRAQNGYGHRTNAIQGFLSRGWVLPWHPSCPSLQALPSPKPWNVTCSPHRPLLDLSCQAIALLAISETFTRRSIFGPPGEKWELTCRKRGHNSHNSPDR